MADPLVTERTQVNAQLEYYVHEVDAQARAADLNGRNPLHRAVTFYAQNLPWTREGQVVWAVYFNPVH